MCQIGTQEQKLAPDIYFDAEFPKLYEKIEHGESTAFQTVCEYGKITHTFLKREIPQFVDGVQYYDAITAYGYGGPIIEKLKTPDGISEEQARTELVAKFQHEYERYCAENRIVSEFVRFHPLFRNADDFKNIFDVVYLRNTVGTNLEEYPDFMVNEYSKGCRKNIKQAIKKGVTVEITEAPESLDEFKNIYYSTMDRNHAAEYYYFQDDYFEACLKTYRDHIILVRAIFEGKTIAAGMYLLWDHTVHIHLSGTLSEYLYLSPAYLLRYGVTMWAVEHGYKMIHHGGGKSNDPEDSLYLFKKQFGKNTEFPFCVGKKIWDPKTYDKLCDMVQAEDSDFFPAYRKR